MKSSILTVFSYFEKVVAHEKSSILTVFSYFFTAGNMGTAIDLSQKLGLRLTPRFYYGGGVKCVAEDGNAIFIHV